MRNRRGLVFIGGVLVGLAAMVSAGGGQEPPGALPSAGDPALGLPGHQAESQGQPLAVRAGFTAPAANGRVELRVTATIQSGWHIYSVTQAAGGPMATKISLDPSGGSRLIGPIQVSPPPDKKEQPVFGKGFIAETHEGTVTWSAPIELPAGAEPGKLAVRGLLSAQACLGDERCEQREVPFTATLGGNPPPAGAEPGRMPVPPGTSTGRMPVPPAGLDLSQLGVLLALAFAGGLILNVMPCVLPVISLKILSFLEQGGQSRGRVFALNVWYCVGLMSYFVLLAVLATAPSLRLSWGEQFTLPWFKVALTALVFAMALSFLGVWEIPIPGFMGRGGASALQAREGASGAFFKGVFATLLATPCSGPLLGPIFGHLLGQPPQLVYGVFVAMGLGMASPYLVLGAFPGLLRFLPKPGAWMEVVQQLMAFLLLATVVYLFFTMAPQYFVPTLALLVGVWFGAWLVGRTPLTAGPLWRAAAWATAAATIALVGSLAFTLLLLEPKLAWQPYSPEALAKARREGKTVMVDFSAHWCPTCLWNLKTSVETEPVQQLVERNGVLPLLADWTDRSPMIKQALNELGCDSIPQLVIYAGGRPGEKPKILSDLITQGQVLEALKEAGPSRSRN
ncbi:MAG: thioredoxin family protein [Thermoguttaceae bacterium]